MVGEENKESTDDNRQSINKNWNTPRELNDVREMPLCEEDQVQIANGEMDPENIDACCPFGDYGDEVDVV